MSNVIDLKLHEGNVYTETFGVKNSYNGASIEFDSVANKFWLLRERSLPIEFRTRKDLAEFLWMAVRLVDSEGRWEKDKYVGLNY